MTPSPAAVLAELGGVLDKVTEQSVQTACDMLNEAGLIMLYGCGREGLQMQGFAMRLYHLGLKVGMVGDMNAPPLGAGDLFVVSAGPGHLSTVTALMQVARRDGARTLFLTAEPKAEAAALADHILHIPAQTMASDQRPNKQSLLPMGSVYEGALYFIFEILILRLREQLGVSVEDMRARHTNME